MISRLLSFNSYLTCVIISMSSHSIKLLFYNSNINKQGSLILNSFNNEYQTLLGADANHSGDDKFIAIKDGRNKHPEMFIRILTAFIIRDAVWSKGRSSD